MKLIIVSGRSGSGKSTALHVLEDLGYYCIDNLPIGLLFPLTREAANQSAPGRLDKMAVSIDARNLSGELANFEDIYRKLRKADIQVEIIYLDADEQSLLQRFHATRRKHPLSDEKTSLREAIDNEKALLEPLSKLADLYINTKGLSMYELRDMVKQRVAGRKDQELALLFQSFGFKHGVPLDSDSGKLDSFFCRQQSQLHDHFHWMHGRPASLGLHLRTAGEVLSRAQQQRTGAPHRVAAPAGPERGLTQSDTSADCYYQ